jgi:hypothetical protein
MSDLEDKLVGQLRGMRYRLVVPPRLHRQSVRLMDYFCADFLGFLGETECAGRLNLSGDQKWALEALSEGSEESPITRTGLFISHYGVPFLWASYTRMAPLRGLRYATAQHQGTVLINWDVRASRAHSAIVSGANEHAEEPPADILFLFPERKIVREENLAPIRRHSTYQSANAQIAAEGERLLLEYSVGELEYAQQYLYLGEFSPIRGGEYAAYGHNMTATLSKVKQASFLPLPATTRA